MELEKRSEISAGGVVYRRHGADFEILLGDQRDWNTGAQTVRLPKGHLDPGETSEQAALREVREETGRAAEIEAALGEVRYEYVDSKRKRVVDKRVVYFLMRDTGAAAGPRDDEMQRIFWVSPNEAERKLTFPAERDVLARARKALADAG